MAVYWKGIINETDLATATAMTVASGAVPGLAHAIIGATTMVTACALAHIFTISFDVDRANVVPALYSWKNVWSKQSVDVVNGGSLIKLTVSAALFIIRGKCWNSVPKRFKTFPLV